MRHWFKRSLQPNNLNLDVIRDKFQYFQRLLNQIGLLMLINQRWIFKNTDILTKET